MAQFDVYRLNDGLVVDCQADALSHYDTRLVAPLMAPEVGPLAAKRFNPVFTINGQRLVMYTQYASAIARRRLGEHVISLDDQRDAIIAALDVLITGV